MMSAMLKLRARRAALTNEDKGFSLIELLVVVLILGILAAIAIPVFIGQQNSAQDSAVKSDLANAKVAVIAHAAANNGTYLTTYDAALDAYGWPVGAQNALAAGGSLLTLGGTATGTFCIQATSKSTGNPTFATSDKESVKAGTCAANAFVAP